jgi:hypothetical protein
MNRITKALILSTVYVSLTAAQFSAAGDSVYTTPAKPTTKDSITYNFYDSDACCCAQFVNPTVSVSDTIVYLSFSVNTAPCQLCKCSAAGAWNAFKGGPFKAGKYAIYREQSFYCPPGSLCPAIVLLPVRIGQVVVAPDTTTYPQFRLTPQSPAPQDSVSLWFVKGTSQSCYPVGYFTSFSISDDHIVCIKAPCPSGYTIKILYRQLLVGIVCLPPLPPPTEYGPHFAFGKLAAGFYTVKDSTDSNKTVFQFSVGENTSIRSPVSLSQSGLAVSQITFCSGFLRLNLNQAERLSISAYTITGRKIPVFSQTGYFSQGANSIELKKHLLPGGVVIVRIEGEGFSENARINVRE